MGRRIMGLLFGAIAFAGTVGAPAAVADGLPVPGVVTPSGGVPGPDGVHYVTSSHEGTTTVRAVGPDAHSRALKGRFTVPAVALDGSPSGLSADGSTLALIKPRRSFPQSKTKLVVLDTGNFSIRNRLTLNGDFSFDAISPDGSELFFIEYLSPRDPTRYAVRGYDLGSGRLLPKPIVDPDEHAGEMRGYPMTRTMSADGRWAYTLYDGGGKEPFVHALDTFQGRAACIDLDGLVGPRDVSRISMTLASDRNRLTLAGPKGIDAVIDTQTLEASAPGAPVQTAAGGGGDFPWMLGLLAATGALLGAGALILIRHRRGHRLTARDA